MVLFFIKVSLSIGIFYLFYLWVLQRETFFEWNRIYLLSSLLLSFLFPFLTIPKLVDQQGTVPVIVHESINSIESKAEDISKDFSSTIVDNTEAGYSKQEGLTGSKKGKELDGNYSPTFSNSSGTGWNWGVWLLGLYVFGVIMFTLQLLFQFCNIIWKIVRTKDKVRDGKFILVNLNEKHAPCSFFNYIFIYPDEYDFNTYQQIIEHEKIHAKQWHTADLLIAELAVIILWFNPLIWWFKKEVEKNLEFQVDRSMLDCCEADKESYQLSLLKVTVPHKPLTITTNYNQSLLKQRILMMNRKRSSVHSYWKFTFIFPLILGLILFLNEPVESQVISMKRVSSGPQVEQVTVSETKVQQAEGEAVVEKEEKQQAIPIPIQEEVRQISFPNQINGEEVDISKGNWTGQRQGDLVCFELAWEGNSERWSWTQSTCFTPRKASVREGEAFTYRNDVGTLIFYGSLPDPEANGRYEFSLDPSFKNYLTGKDIEYDNPNYFFQLFLGGVDRAYVELILQRYNSVEYSELLLQLALQGTEKDKLLSYSQMFEEHDGEDVTLEEVILAKAVDMKPGYIKGIRDLGYQDLDFSEFLQAKILNIEIEYIKELQDVGLEKLEFQDIITAKANGIDGEWIRAKQKEGYNLNTVSEYIQLIIKGTVQKPD